MSFINPPPHIDAIFDEPGRDWSPGERERVIEWLLEDRQFRYLLSFTLRRLGVGATHEDAEDVIGEFFARRLDPVIESYDPNEGRRFWNYLLFCLARFCKEEGDKIRRRHDHEQPIVTQSPQGQIIELDFIASGLSPEETLANKERQQILLRCLKRLSMTDQQVIVLPDFAQMPLAEVADALSISVANVKVRRLRARHQLAESLPKEGLTL